MKFLHEFKIFENVNLAKKILNQLNIPVTDKGYTQLRELLGIHLGFLGAFTRFHYIDKIDMNRLRDLYKEIQQKKPFMGSLPKNINQYNSYEELTDDLDNINHFIRFNKVVKELPSKLKQNGRDSKELYNLIQSMSDTMLTQYIGFIKAKSSAYRNIDELTDATQTFLQSFSSQKEILKKIEQTKGAELVYNENNIIIAVIRNEETSKKLGSSSWCISTRGMWEDYNSIEKMTKQYFVWNFNVPFSSNDSMLGVTINRDGTPSATHLRNDNSTNLVRYTTEYGIPRKIFSPLSKGELVQYFKQLKSITINDVKLMAELDVWQELTKIIPKKWRMRLGLSLPNEEFKMSAIQKIILTKDSKSAAKFIKSEYPINSFLETIMFIQEFNTIKVDDQDWQSRLLDKWVKEAKDDNPYITSIDVDVDVDGIEVYISDWDFYYSLFDCEQHIADIARGNYDPEAVITFEYDEEMSHIFGYLDDKKIKEISSLIKKLYKKNLNKIPQEKWYDTLKSMGLADACDTFLRSLDSRVEDELTSDVKKAEKRIIFDIEQTSSRDSKGYILFKYETLSAFCIENDIQSLSDAFDAKPNRVSDIIDSEGLYFAEYVNKIPTEDLVKEFAENLLSDIMHNADDYEYKRMLNSKYGEITSKLGFKSDFLETNQYTFRILVFNEATEEVVLVIKDNQRDRTVKVSIKLDELPKYVTNTKLDFMFPQ